MKSKAAIVMLALLLLAALATGTSWANDKVISTITIPDGQPQPIIEVNGVAQGNIRLNYTVVGTTFPCGPFAQFQLGLAAQRGTGQVGGYPVQLNLSDSGKGTPVQLVPSPPDFSVSGVGWSGSSLITVSINCSKVSSTPGDGDVLDGQMNESTAVISGNGSAHLDTITTVQVHVKLAVPAVECLKLYSFESDQDSGALLSSVVVNPNKSGTVKSTNPGQVSVDALVVNTCSEPRSFDLAIGLDPDWQTSPHGNPGNATFSFTTTGEYDLTTYNLAAFGTGTSQGEKLCLTNILLADGYSFLTRVHSAIRDEISASSLPSQFNFSATLSSANSSCLGSQLTDVGPSNPAESHLSYTIK